MANFAGQQFSATRNLWLKGTGTLPGSIRLTRGSTDPGFGANDGDFLYNLNGNLVYEAAGTTTTLGAVGGVGTTWESLYSNDNAWSLNGAFTITQAGNNAWTIDKTATGAGAVLALQNAGTGVDLSIINVTAGATGVVLNTFANSASAADNDVIFEHLVRGADDAQASVSYGRVRFLVPDVSAGTEDATYQLALMLGGTSRTVLDITGDLMIFGSGQANAVITSSGALDLILETNSGTNSGTIRIYDGANGNIEFLNNGSGDVTIPTSGIVQGGTTPTRSTFATDGTTGIGFSVTTATITSGDVLRVNHSDAGTFNGGFLINATVASSSVMSVAEDGAIAVAGTAAAAAFTATAGNLVLSQGTVAVTSTGTGDVVSITANSVLANNGLIVTGSGTFTGTGANSWVNITASGLTTGTALTVIANTANTTVGLIDVSATGLTSGSVLRMTVDTATFTTGGKMIELTSTAAVAGNHLTATTTGAYTGTGMILVTAGAATTGILVSLVSTTGMTTGSLLRGTTSTAGAVATNGIFSLRATGAYTSTADAGLLDVQASALVGTGTIVNIKATNGSQLTNSALNIEQTTTTTGYTGDFVKIIGTSTTGDCNLIAVTTASTSAGDALQITGNGLVAGTSTLVNLVHTTSVLGAGNSMLRITSTSSDTGTTTGCLLDLASSAATAGTLVLMVSATLATGSGFVQTLNGLTTGVGHSIGHTTGVIANGGSLMRLTSSANDTSTTTGCLLDLASTASTTGVQMLATLSGLTDGKGFRMVANAMTTGMMIDLESSAAGMNGLYLRCYDGAAVDFSVGVDGRLVVAGAAGIAAITVTAGDITTADGAIASAAESVTVAAAATTFAVDSNYVILTGDAGANTIATITGGVAGQILMIECVDGLVTFADDNTHGANTIDLLGANIVSADDTMLVLAFNGTSWYMLVSSVND